MRRFEDLNFYELFEIPPNASAFEIRQAYRNALSIYGDDSAIADAFFTKEEKTKILHKIEEAFSTLIDDIAREQYDRTLVAEKIIEPSAVTKVRAKVPTALFSAKSSGKEAISKKIENGARKESVRHIAGDIVSADTVSGKDLQKLRIAVGVEIEDVFDVTRISTATLEAIENDRMADLPPKVYLRNFLKAYAELFEIDAQKVIEGYQKNLDRIRSAS